MNGLACLILTYWFSKVRHKIFQQLAKNLDEIDEKKELKRGEMTSGYALLSYIPPSILITIRATDNCLI